MMWKKSYILLLASLFLCCSPPLVFSQSTPTSSWAEFDKLLEQARSELTSLQQELTLATQSLTASQEELATLKARLVEREIAVQNLERLLTQYKQSALTSEADLRASSRLNVILGIAAIIGGGAAVYFAVR